MNYISAVYGVIVFILPIDWIFRGRKDYGDATHSIESIEPLTGEESDNVSWNLLGMALERYGAGKKELVIAIEEI